MREIGQRQLELYTFLLDFIEKNGFQPNAREIAAGLRISTKTALSRLNELQEMGYVTLPVRPHDRAIRLHFVGFKAVFSGEKTGGT